MSEIKIKKTTLYVLGIILLVIIAGYFIVVESNSLTGGVIGNVVQGDSNEDVQKVVLGIKNYNYYPNIITVDANRPVRIYLDSSVVGCFRSFTIRDLGIIKYLPTPNDYVEFTPAKTGTYRFACGMGMGTGTLIVEWKK